MTDTAVIETPVSTPTTESTPAPAAIAQPSVAVETPRPTSMKAALEQADKAVEPSTPQVQATIPPVEGQPALEKPAGPIPFEAHKTALENARTKAVAEYVEHNPVVKWVSGLPQESLQSLVNWTPVAQRMTTDPVGFVKAYLAEVQAARPDLAPQLTGLFQQPARPPDPMPEPDVQIMNDQGQVTGKTYSAEQLAKRDEWRERNFMAKVNEQFAPIVKEREQRLLSEQQAAARQHVEKATDEIMADIKGLLDGREDLYTAVDALMAQGLSAHRAAMQVREKHIVPSIAEKARLAAIESQKLKAAGNTANGTGTSTVPPKRPSNPKELARFLEEQSRA